MKILYIIEGLGSGGKERRLLALLKGLHEHHRIELLLLSPIVHYKEVYSLNISIHYLGRNLWNDFNLLGSFRKTLKMFSPDIVHCWDNIATLHFGPICRISHIPFVNSMISSAPANLSIYSKSYLVNYIAYYFSDVVLANSQAGLTSFRAPKNKSKVIYNGFDMERLKIKRDQDDIRKEFNIRTSKVVGMTASFSKMKDYPTFVIAAQAILKRRKDITFIAIGDGPMIEDVKEMIKKENREFFRFLGRQHDVESIVNVFDVGVLSTYTEGISNSIMEYMALSKPVVATDGGGTKELVLDDETGLLIDERNPRQLAQKVLFLLDNPEKTKSMGEKGRTRIEKYFSISKMVDDTLKLYNDQIK